MAASRTRLDLNSKQHSSPLPCIESEDVVIPEPKKIAEMLNKPHFNDRSKLAAKFNVVNLLLSKLMILLVGSNCISGAVSIAV